MVYKCSSMVVRLYDSHTPGSISPRATIGSQSAQMEFRWRADSGPILSAYWDMSRIKWNRDTYQQ